MCSKIKIIIQNVFFNMYFRFECKRGFTLVGSRDNECINPEEGPKWDQDMPSCKRNV